jgi:hypothetical protein
VGVSAGKGDIKRLFSNLSPSPPSLSKGRGSADKRGASPLSKVSSPSSLKERGTQGVR